MANIIDLDESITYFLIWVRLYCLIGSVPQKIQENCNMRKPVFGVSDPVQPGADPGFLKRGFKCRKGGSFS